MDHQGDHHRHNISIHDNLFLTVQICPRLACNVLLLTPVLPFLTIVLRRRHLPNRITQLSLQHPSKQLQQDLKADLCNRRIISSLAKLIPDERMLCPRKLMETRCHFCGPQGLPDGIAAGGWYVGVFHAKDHGHFAVFEGGEEVDCGRGGRRF